MIFAWFSSILRAGPARPSFALLLSLALAAACSGKASRDEAALRRERQRKESVEVFRDADRASFAVPADGHLALRQVEMYLDVRRRTRIGPGGDLETAALLAARERGVNLKEYRWVALQVGEARMAGTAQGLREKVAASRTKILAALEERVLRTGDPARRRELEGEIAELRRQTVQPGHEPGGSKEAARFNAALLEPYRDQLAALRREEMELYAARTGLPPEPKGGAEGGELGDKK